MLQTDDTRRSRRRLIKIETGDATGAFARASVLGGLAVIAVASVLQGVAPLATALAAAFYLASVILAGWFVHHRYPHDRLGLGNQVTLVRLVLVSAIVAWVLSGGGPSWSVFGLALLALALDGVDGWFARRQELVSDFGARFDVEVDSVFAILLAVNAAMNPQIGWGVILLGLPRYLFVFAAFFFVWMKRDLPERFNRKLVCVVQLGALIALQAPIVSTPIATLLIAVAAIALIWSFAVDIIWLRRALR